MKTLLFLTPTSDIGLAILLCIGVSALFWWGYSALEKMYAIHLIQLNNKPLNNNSPMYKFTLKPQAAPADQEPVTFLAEKEKIARMNFDLLVENSNPEKPVEIMLYDPNGKVIEHAVIRPRK